MKLKTVRPSDTSSFARFEREHVKPKAGRTLIVGSRVYHDKEDRRLRHANAVGVDMLDGAGVDRVVNLEDELPGDLGLFDHVECMSVLEHSRRPWLLAANVERLMAPGATVFVTVPFMWRIHAYPGDYFRVTPEGLKALFPGIKWESVLLAGVDLYPGPKVEAVKVEGHPYFARTDTVGFGVKA